MKKHYSQSAVLIVLNFLLEFVILLLSYLFSGYMRLHLSFGWFGPFIPADIFAFLKFAAIWSAFMVIAFAIYGDYRTIHYRNLKLEIVHIVFVVFAGGIIGAALLYWFNGYQFSRAWLAMFIVMGIVALSIKRILFDKISTSYYKGNLEGYKLVVVGSGNFLKRFYTGLSNDKASRYEFAGYFSAEENSTIPDYKGTVNELAAYMEHNKVDAVVIAEENAGRDFYTKVLNWCEIFHVSTYVIPAFNDFMFHIDNSFSDINYGGLYCIPIDAKYTESILGVNIAVTNMEKTIDTITENLENWRGKYVCVSNVHTTIMAHDDPKYMEVQNNAVLALPDGGPLSSYSRQSGNAEAERVTGPDLMKEMLKRSGEHKWRHFFYGSSEKTLDILSKTIEKKYPDATVVGMISPPFRALTEEEDLEYIKQINEAKPDFVWVGLGAPKQEYWMAAHEDKINAIMFGVGAAFDYEAGNIDRAPAWMQKANLEWFYRLMQDPKRLFKRYFKTNLKYLWLTRK